MRSIAPRHPAQVDQLHVNLVDEGGRLQGLPGALPCHLPVRPAMEFLIHERRQLLERLLISLAPGPQQLGDIARLRFVPPVVPTTVGAHGF